jgi:hypothetical protein
MPSDGAMTAPIYFLSQISVSIDLNSEKFQNTSFQNGFKFPASTSKPFRVSVHLAKRFQRRKLKKIVQSETRIACGSHVC